ncbi:MAG: DEAD/DEAH box helicase [Sphingomonas sp.]|nr:DEAD/DEAH box helicase [Sphingomonas sp.]
MIYQDFLSAKTHEGAEHGFEPKFMPPQLFDFQQAMVEYSVRKGRAALFEDCGLGKTIQFLTWAQNVVEHTNRPVLILTPLAVAAQTIREGEKFGIECVRSRDGSIPSKIVVTNYERLAHFNPSDFGAVVCDESSILKSFNGSRKAEITNFMRKTPYRLLATATAAPNDYVELGTSSEALGYLGQTDMLNRFFKNEQGNSTATGRMYGEAPEWRFKGHSELPFWRWVCSWARALRSPSDLGFDDGRLILPPLTTAEHLVEAVTLPDGMLFNLPAQRLPEQREEKKRTIQERCERAASLVDHNRPAIIWCQLNDEANLLEQMMPDAVQVSGANSDDLKERRFLDFVDGKVRVLITKPKIGAMGLNFQHCAHVVYFPSHSFEQYYQAVRRCWRFGQTAPVKVDIVLTDGERLIMQNLQRKAHRAETMFDNLIMEMNNAAAIHRTNNCNTPMGVPEWLAA